MNMIQNNSNKSPAGHETDSHTIHCPHCRKVIEMIGNEVKQPEVTCDRCGKHEPKGNGSDIATPRHFLDESADPHELRFHPVHLCDQCLGVYRTYIANQRRHTDWTRPLSEAEKKEMNHAR